MVQLLLGRFYCSPDFTGIHLELTQVSDKNLFLYLIPQRHPDSTSKLFHYSYLPLTKFHFFRKQCSYT